MTLQYDEIIATTKKAVLYRFDDEEHWIPESQIIDRDPEYCTVEVEDWLVEKKGLEAYEV